ncbi:lysosomal-associated transmembrane protein 5 isoform X1 [Tachyglossus aculeatus]|uniref:lysosomal-associated transmembrane protein 5 isoform X1 n=1 Tax=Tachyglossus aculeatus TaxID=9261 RepID=UPI0018F3F678|nr:lysosomal-associated transmembrane protein 5 isoform X1 [Tachyglossus aculeatus]
MPPQIPGKMPSETLVRRAPERRASCFNTRVATTALAGYHMVVSVLLLVEHAVEVANGKGQCQVAGTRSYRLVDITSSFLLLGMLFVVSISLLFGVIKKRERCLLPFLSLQIMDFLLGLLTLLGTYIELPGYLRLATATRARGRPKTPLVALQLLDFCLSVLALCSSYMEVPAYLNFKAMNHMNYLPSQEGRGFLTTMLLFSVAFVAVLTLKVYMFKCVWRCYRDIQAQQATGGKVTPRLLQQVALPSYEEAVALPGKGARPPPYSEV